MQCPAGYAVFSRYMISEVVSIRGMEVTTMRGPTRRLHLFEIHEQPWFPRSLRQLFQESLGLGLRTYKVYGSAREEFIAYLRRLRPAAILDLCTGSGTSAVELLESIRPSLPDAEHLTLHLSDLYPSPEILARYQDTHGASVRYLSEPVDIFRVPENVPRIWTMFTALHHFRPEEVRQLLLNAATRADGIAIFEGTSREWFSIITPALSFLPCMIMTAFVLRPFRLRNVLFSLFLPIIPFVMSFDGVVSGLRSYTTEELQQIVDGLDTPGFRWEVRTLRKGVPVTYVFGWREAA